MQTTGAKAFCDSLAIWQVDHSLATVLKLIVHGSHLGPGLTIGAVHDDGPHRRLSSKQRPGRKDKGGARACPQDIAHLRTLLLVQLGHLQRHDCSQVLEAPLTWHKQARGTMELGIGKTTSLLGIWSDKGCAIARAQDITHLQTLLMVQLGRLRLHNCSQMLEPLSVRDSRLGGTAVVQLQPSA